MENNIEEYKPSKKEVLMVAGKKVKIKKYKEGKYADGSYDDLEEDEITLWKENQEKIFILKCVGNGWVKMCDSEDSWDTRLIKLLPEEEQPYTRTFAEILDKLDLKVVKETESNIIIQGNGRYIEDRDESRLISYLDLLGRVYEVIITTNVDNQSFPSIVIVKGDKYGYKKYK